MPSPLPVLTPLCGVAALSNVGSTWPAASAPQTVAIPIAWEEGANFHPLASCGPQLPFFLSDPMPEPGPVGVCALQTPFLQHSPANPTPLAWRAPGELRMVMWIHWNVRGIRPALGFVHLPRPPPPSSRVPASLRPTVAALSPAWAAPSHPEPHGTKITLA